MFAPAAEKLTVTLRGDSIDIPSTISIISVVVAVGAGLGLLVGIPVGFSIMTGHIKHSIRKRVEKKIGTNEPISYISDTRKEARVDIKSLIVNMLDKSKQVDHLLVDIRVPVLDAAGIPIINEEKRVTAKMVNISTQGASIISDTFIPVGLDIMIACKSKKLSFEYRDAEVRYVILEKEGLRMGVQFFEPIDID